MSSVFYKVFCCGRGSSPAATSGAAGLQANAKHSTTPSAQSPGAAQSVPQAVIPPPIRAQAGSQPGPPPQGPQQRHSQNQQQHHNQTQQQLVNSQPLHAHQSQSQNQPQPPQQQNQPTNPAPTVTPGATPGAAPGVASVVPGGPPILASVIVSAVAPATAAPATAAPATAAPATAAPATAAPATAAPATAAPATAAPATAAPATAAPATTAPPATAAAAAVGPQPTALFAFEFPLDGTNVDPWDPDANKYLNKILGGKKNWQLWTESALDRMTLRTIRELKEEEKATFMKKAGPGRL